MLRNFSPNLPFMVPEQRLQLLLLLLPLPLVLLAPQQQLQFLLFLLPFRVIPKVVTHWFLEGGKGQ